MADERIGAGLVESWCGREREMEKRRNTQNEPNCRRSNTSVKLFCKVCYGYDGCLLV